MYNVKYLSIRRLRNMYRGIMCRYNEHDNERNTLHQAIPYSGNCFSLQDYCRGSTRESWAGSALVPELVSYAWFSWRNLYSQAPYPSSGSWRLPRAITAGGTRPARLRPTIIATRENTLTNCIVSVGKFSWYCFVIWFSVVKIELYGKADSKMERLGVELDFILPFPALSHSCETVPRIRQEGLFQHEIISHARPT